MYLNGYLLVSFAIILHLAICKKSSGEAPESKRACFIIGDDTFPADVRVNPQVTCDFCAEEPFKGLPDVIFGGLKYSEVDFQTDYELSPVGFALKNFPTDGDKKDLERFTNLNEVYSAMNAGLRSLGNRKRDVKKLKGPNFFIQFQLTRINKDPYGVQGTLHKLGKVLKNCVGCTKEERKAVIDLAIASGVDVSKLKDTKKPVNPKKKKNLKKQYNPSNR